MEFTFTQTTSHTAESCPLTKLNGGLSLLHSADEDTVSWLTNYGSRHADEKKKTSSHTGDANVKQDLDLLISKPISKLCMRWATVMSHMGFLVLLVQALDRQTNKQTMCNTINFLS